MTNIDDLVLWLREQIAEKRRRAMATRFLPDDPAPAWTYDEYHHRVVIQAEDQQVGVASKRAGTTPSGEPYEDLVLNADGAHMELNDPQAAVAECDAHTALLDVAERAHTEWMVDVVLALGLAYQHRPGYREEWRP